MTVYLGRNARLFKAGIVVAYSKKISIAATAEIIKVYSNDALTPALTGAGKQTFTWSIDKLFVTGSLLTDLKAGTKFTLIYASSGSSTVAPYITLTNCTI